VKIAVRVRPGARRERVGGCWDAPAQCALLVEVPARAVEGRANEAVAAALARAFGLRRSQVTILTGHRCRNKLVELAGGAAEVGLPARLAELLGR
jgi:uncharacterized protein YggU (UPF0235/DUF167 family)